MSSCGGGTPVFEGAAERQVERILAWLGVLGRAVLVHLGEREILCASEAERLLDVDFDALAALGPAFAVRSARISDHAVGCRLGGDFAVVLASDSVLGAAALSRLERAHAILASMLRPSAGSTFGPLPPKAGGDPGTPADAWIAVLDDDIEA